MNRLLAAFIGLFVGFTALSLSAKPVRSSLPNQCVAVVTACRKAGFVNGRGSKHPGVGLWSGCVRPLSKGTPVPGVKGVSKSAALRCLKTRHAATAGKS